MSKFARIPIWFTFLLVSATFHTVFAADSHSHEHHDEDDMALRELAAQPTEDHHTPPLANVASRLHVKIFSINDFHGQLSAGRRVGNRPVGGAAVLAAYLKAAQQGMEEQTVIVHAGDHVGASPPASALLQDEPSISFLNLLANKHCRDKKPRRTRCNMVATLGNHEFDEGKDEMLRLIEGGNHANGPFLENPYQGARFPYVSANVVDTATGKPILPPYVIKKIKGIPVAFIGAVLKETPTIVTPSGVAGISFLDEADAINSYIPKLKKAHVRAIVVLIHQGGRQTTYQGSTAPNAAAVDGNIVNIVSRLDDEIDVVVSGHAHSFTNALLKNQHGKEILVTQAFSSSTAYGDIDLQIDRATRDVVSKSAAIITTYADAGPGLAPDTDVALLVKQAEDKVAPLVNQVIGETPSDIVRTQNAAGESALGNLIADAQRAAMNTDFAFMNPGGIRADISAGSVTWGELFAVQPFGNSLVKMELSGQQIYTLLNQQWLDQPFPRIMQISGLSYTWDNNRAVGDRIVEVRKNGVPIVLANTYTVTVNSFMAAGGDNFSVLTQGSNQVGGPIDLDALIAHIQTLPQPFSAPPLGRIQRLN